MWADRLGRVSGADHSTVPGLISIALLRSPIPVLIGMEHDRRRLPRLARAGPSRGAARTPCSAAEQAGFDAAMCSDHFAPWSERQGHSGVRVGLARRGAGDHAACRSASSTRRASATTRRSSRRRSATLAAMFPGRFWVALGTGEASTSTSPASGWPRKEERNARLRECVEVIRALLARRGGQPRRAWSPSTGPGCGRCPDEPPPLIGRGGHARDRRLGGGWADGLITVNQPPDALRQVVDAYRDAGGRGTADLQVHLSYAPTTTRRCAIAHDQWRSNVFGPPVCWDLDRRRGTSTRSSTHVRPEDVRDGVLVSHDPGATPTGCASSPPSASTGSTCTTSARTQDRVHRRVRRRACCRSSTWRQVEPMRITDTSDLWWKNAVIYCLDVETFLDCNGDGIGDFPGLAQRIDYLAELGVTCLWLMPFYPTPDRDDGYDITDFYGVDPRLGHARRPRRVDPHRQRPRHAGDRRPRRQPHLRPASLVQGARGPAGRRVPRLLRLARQAAADAKPRSSSPTRRQRLDARRAGRRVLPAPLLPPPARPERRQPAGPRRDRQGHGVLAGARACPGSASTPCRSSWRRPASRTASARCPTRTSYLRDLRAFISRRSGDAILLGEVNLRPRGPAGLLRRRGRRRAARCCSTSSACSGCTCRWPAATPRPLVDALDRGRRSQHERQWATFVRNHDELTLDKLTDGERQEVFAAFGPDQDMQIYGRGLRRRLPPMLGGDPRRIRMVYSLLFSLPGTPCCSTARRSAWARTSRPRVRMAVRTPMQWTAGRNGGFSTAAAVTPVRPRDGGRFAPEHVNVAAQRRDPDSLLSLHAAADPALPRVPGARLGRLRGARAAGPGGARPPLHLGRRVDGRPAQPVGRDPTVAAAGRLREETRLVDLLVDGIMHPDARGRVRDRARGLRLPLAAGHASRFPAPPVTTRWPPR